MRNGTLAITAAASASLLAASATAALGSAYSDAVLALNPTHYYGLDETTVDFGTPIVVDSGSAHTNGLHEGFYPPAEVGVQGATLFGFELPGMGGAANRAINSADSGGVRLGAGTDFAADVMSVAMWFRAPGGVQIGDRLFTNNVVRLNGGTEDSFQMVFTNGASGWSMAFVTGNEDPQNPETMQLGIPSAIQFVQDDQWHHVVAVRNGDDIRNLTVVMDGVNLTPELTPTSAGWGTTGSNAHLGVRADDGFSDHNHNGQIDDSAIFMNKALTVAEAQGLYDAGLGYLIADANEDGQVSVADVGIVATNFGLQPPDPAGRRGGDFNRDGVVSVADVGILATFFGQPIAPASSEEFAAALAAYPELAAAVPEPMSAACVAGAGLALLVARRRRR